MHSLKMLLFSSLLLVPVVTSFTVPANLPFAVFGDRPKANSLQSLVLASTRHETTPPLNIKTDPEYVTHEGSPSVERQSTKTTISKIPFMERGLSATIFTFLTITLNYPLHTSFWNINLDFPEEPALLAAISASYILGLGFETLKIFPGPSLLEMPMILHDIQKHGFLSLMESLKAKHGSIFSIGPLTVVTGNAKAVDTVFRNTKLPTTLPGLPRDAGLASNDPQTVLRGRTALLSFASHKEPSRAVFNNIAHEFQPMLDSAIFHHQQSRRRRKTDGTPSSCTGSATSFEFRKRIARPMASAINAELIFNISALNSQSAKHATQKRAKDLQALGMEITKYFGATGVLGTLFRPWRLVRAWNASQTFLKLLEETVSPSAMSEKGMANCPISQIRDSLQSGKISINDALQFTSAFIYTGTESIEIVSEGVMWMLAHPQNAKLQQECRQEVDRVFGGNGAVTAHGDLLAECHLLRSTVAEALRRYEFAMPFKAMREFRVHDTTVPNGSWMLVTGFNNMETSAATGKTEWIHSPYAFNPKVWLDEHGRFDEKLLTKFSFFGQGQHKCPGRQLGLDAVVCILAATLSHFDDISFDGDADYSNIPVENLSQFRSNIRLRAMER